MQEQETIETAVETPQNEFNPFSDEGSVEVPVNVETIEQQVAQAPTQNSQNDDDDEIVDANDYLKKTLGFDDWESAKNEIESLREKSKSGVKFDNEESEKVYKLLAEGKVDEVLNVIQEQKKVNKLVNESITDSSAEDIIKYGLQLKNSNLSKDEIDFLYTKKYALPEKPSQEYTEEDDDYNQRLQSWQRQVDDKKKEMIIDAKLALPDLEKYNQEIKLPSIESQQAQQVSPEELEQLQKFKENYDISAKKALSEFNGYTFKYNDASVKDLEVSYQVDEQEKQAIDSAIKTFAERNFDANALLADLWLTEDGNINIKRMTEDLHLLYNKEKVLSKLINETGAKRFAEVLKQKSNIDTTSQPKGTFQPQADKTEYNKLADTIWDA